jgi:hypothetical protein
LALRFLQRQNVKRNVVQEKEVQVQALEQVQEVQVQALEQVQYKQAQTQNKELEQINQVDKVNDTSI